METLEERVGGLENRNDTRELVAVAAAAAIGGIWLYRRSQKPAPLTINTDQLAHLAQLPAPEEAKAARHRANLTEEEVIRLAQLTEEEEEEEIRLAKLSLRERRRQGGGITIL